MSTPPPPITPCRKPPTARHVRMLALGLGFVSAVAAHAFADTRSAEIAECRAGEIQTWPDGTDRRVIAPALRLAYRHQRAPAWFPADQVEALIRQAVTAWKACGVPMTIVPASSLDMRDAGSILVQWGKEGNRSHFGLANITTRTLTLEPAAFAMLREKNPGEDASQTLQQVIAHEMGHFLGLMAHSRRCVDVMSYYNDGQGGKCYVRAGADVAANPQYRHVLPTACDIARCRAVNGLSPGRPPSPLRPAPPTARRPY